MMILDKGNGCQFLAEFFQYHHTFKKTILFLPKQINTLLSGDGIGRNSYCIFGKFTSLCNLCTLRDRRASKTPFSYSGV
jgi:hypothetical protein